MTSLSRCSDRDDEQVNVFVTSGVYQENTSAKPGIQTRLDRNSRCSLVVVVSIVSIEKQNVCSSTSCLVLSYFLRIIAGYGFCIELRMNNNAICDALNPIKQTVPDPSAARGQTQTNNLRSLDTRMYRQHSKPDKSESD